MLLDVDVPATCPNDVITACVAGTPGEVAAIAVDAQYWRVIPRDVLGPRVVVSRTRCYSFRRGRASSTVIHVTYHGPIQTEYEIPSFAVRRVRSTPVWQILESQRHSGLGSVTIADCLARATNRGSPPCVGVRVTRNLDVHLG